MQVSGMQKSGEPTGVDSPPFVVGDYLRLGF